MSWFECDLLKLYENFGTKNIDDVVQQTARIFWKNRQQIDDLNECIHAQMCKWSMR